MYKVLFACLATNAHLSLYSASQGEERKTHIYVKHFNIQLKLISMSSASCYVLHTNRLLDKYWFSLFIETLDSVCFFLIVIRKICKSCGKCHYKVSRFERVQYFFIFLNKQMNSLLEMSNLKMSSALSQVICQRCVRNFYLLYQMKIIDK